MKEQTSTKSEELKRAIRVFFQKPPSPPHPGPVNIAPGCAFGALLGQQLQDLERNLAELKGRLNGLIFVVIGAVIAQMVLRFLP